MEYVIRDSSESNPSFHDFDVGGPTGLESEESRVTVYGIHREYTLSFSIGMY